MNLSEIMTQVRGLSYSKKDSRSAYFEDSIPVLRAGNIQDARILQEDYVFVSNDLVKDKQYLKQGDILIAASSGSISIVGKAAMVQSDMNATFGAFCKVLRPNAEKVNLNYFKHFFETAYYKRTIKSLAEGANINNLKTEHFDNLEIPLPPLDQQKKIAAILDAADAYRQKTKALIEKYDELTRSLFLDMFGDPVTNPKGWTTKPMGELADLKMGGTPSTKHPEYYENGTINWMKSGDIKGDFIINFPNKITQLGLENSNTKLYNKNTVVIALNGQGKTRGTTGLITESTCSNQSVANIDPGNNMNSAFLHFQLKSRYKLLRNLTGDNDRSGLNLTILRNYKIYIPEMELQYQFAERVQAIEAQKAQAQASLAQAEDLFNSLLQRAFKGELV